MSKTGDSKLSRSEFMNRGMTKFTDIQKGYLKQYVGECIMNRFTTEESLLYLKDKLGIDLDEDEFEYLKEHSKKDLKRNIEYLRRHENAYIQEYFDRIEEMRLIAKRLWKLVEENPHNPILQKDCLSELGKSTIAKAGFYQSIRELDQEITTLKEEPESISVSGPETKPTSTSKFEPSESKEEPESISVSGPETKPTSTSKFEPSESKEEPESISVSGPETKPTSTSKFEPSESKEEPESISVSGPETKPTSTSKFEPSESKEEPESISVSSPETKPAPPPEVEIPQQSSPKKIARYTSEGKPYMTEPSEGKPYMTEPSEGKPYMTEPAVLDWDRIIHKNVRSSDGQDAGNVDATYGDSVVIITEGAREEYKVPKSQVEGYNGAEVLLKLTAYELEKYRV